MYAYLSTDLPQIKAESRAQERCEQPPTSGEAGASMNAVRFLYIGLSDVIVVFILLLTYVTSAHLGPDLHTSQRSSDDFKYLMDGVYASSIISSVIPFAIISTQSGQTAVDSGLPACSLTRAFATIGVPSCVTPLYPSPPVHLAPPYGSLNDAQASSRSGR